MIRGGPLQDHRRRNPFKGERGQEEVSQGGWIRPVRIRSGVGA